MHDLRSWGSSFMILAKFVFSGQNHLRQLGSHSGEEVCSVDNNKH